MTGSGVRTEAALFHAKLIAHQGSGQRLPGLSSSNAVDSLALQIVESLRRNRYVEYLRSTQLSGRVADPTQDAFDPVRAAIWLHEEGDYDEACWMIFLYTHFGKNRRSGFSYARDIYGALGSGSKWTFARTLNDVSEFRQWLQENKEKIRQKNKPGGFGNHRKYESLDGWSDKGTGAVFETYVDWVGPQGHAARFALVEQDAGQPLQFDDLCAALKSGVRKFGRTACFDYVMMANKTGLIDCPPTHAHLRSATGPAEGARLLFTGSAESSVNVRLLESEMSDLQSALAVGFDVLEDAICNWQKSPDVFKSFRG